MRNWPHNRKKNLFCLDQWVSVAEGLFISHSHTCPRGSMGQHNVRDWSKPQKTLVKILDQRPYGNRTDFHTHSPELFKHKIIRKQPFTTRGTANCSQVHKNMRHGLLSLQKQVQWVPLPVLKDLLSKQNSCNFKLWSVLLVGWKYLLIFVNCNWVAIRWQQYSTHLHTNSTQNNTKQYTEQHKNFGRVWAVPRLCGFYPGICLTSVEKAQKNPHSG